MSVEETHKSGHGGPPAMDVLVALLGAGVIAGVVWSVVYSTFAGAAFGLDYFKIALPEVVTNGLHLAARVLPVLAAIPAAWFGYKFILRLP